MVSMPSWPSRPRRCGTSLAAVMLVMSSTLGSRWSRSHPAAWRLGGRASPTGAGLSATPFHTCRSCAGDRVAPFAGQTGYGPYLSEAAPDQDRDLCTASQAPRLAVGEAAYHGASA